MVTMGKKIEKFLETYTSESTIKTYKYILNNYFECQDVSEDQYFNVKRDYEEDIRKFFIKISDRPPKSVRTVLSTVKTFLSENDIDLPDKFWRGITGRLREHGH